MCGIIGYIGKKPPNKELFNKARDLLNHRGPDFGHTKFYFFKDKKIYFGHRRLSIIDISKYSNQPYEYKNLSLIFNGEIYNYIELRNTLKKRGYSFSTSGDVEVLIKSIHFWGVKAFNHLDGMWSLAVFNKKNGETIFSRDRFGEKPFFYTKLKNDFLFSSEISPILFLKPEASNINHSQIIRFCINGYKSLKKQNKTFFNDIHELEPGNYLILKDNKFVIKKYWRPSFKINKKLKYENVISEVKSLIINSVQQKLRSDAKLAFTLSGGIDTNTITSIASKILNINVNTFSIINKDKNYSELNYIKLALKNLKCSHQFINIKNVNFINDLTKLISKRKSPVLTISHYLYGKMTEAVSSRGYKVILGGYGSDEIFTGYYDHFNLNFYNLKSSDIEKYKKEKYYWLKYIKPYVRNPSLKKNNLYIKNKNFREHIYLNQKLFRSFLNVDWEDSFQEKYYSKDLLRNRMLNEFFHESIPPALNEEDLQSMNNSIENRNPFLDKSLFEFMQKVPSNYLINNGYSKKILRDAMNGIVDNKILSNRRKIGFNAPLEDIFNLNLKKNREFILDNSEIYEYFKKNKIEKFLYKKKHKFSNSLSKFMFNFISCKIFLENISF